MNISARVQHGWVWKNGCPMRTVCFSPCATWLGLEEWPTNEMRERGELRSLLLGVFVAIPSGAGVALSVLGREHFKLKYIL